MLVLRNFLLPCRTLAVFLHCTFSVASSNVVDLDTIARLVSSRFVPFHFLALDASPNTQTKPERAEFKVDAAVRRQSFALFASRSKLIVGNVVNVAVVVIIIVVVTVVVVIVAYRCRVLIQLSTHILGIKIRLLAETSMRNTFYKVGESLLVRRELELEKQLKEKMIHSVMPPSVAQWLMSNTANDGNEDEERIDIEANHQLQVRFLVFERGRAVLPSRVFGRILDVRSIDVRTLNVRTFVDRRLFKACFAA